MNEDRYYQQLEAQIAGMRRLAKDLKNPARAKHVKKTLTFLAITVRQNPEHAKAVLYGIDAMWSLLLEDASRGVRQRGLQFELNARCSDCLNLRPDNWCAAKNRTAPGTRHLRKCDFFQQGKLNPTPTRPGKPQPSGLVQCVKCQYFSGWGLCEAGVGEISGELAPCIWRCVHAIALLNRLEPVPVASTC